MNAEEMRTRAAICRALAVTAAIGSERLRYRRMAVGWQEQAENQDWLDGVVSPGPTVQPELDRAA